MTEIEQMPVHLLLAVCMSLESKRKFGDFSRDDAFPLFLYGLHAEDRADEIERLVIDEAHRRFGDVVSLLANDKPNFYK